MLNYSVPGNRGFLLLTPILGNVGLMLDFSALTAEVFLPRSLYLAR